MPMDTHRGAPRWRPGMEQCGQQLVEADVGIGREPAVRASARTDLGSVRKVRFADVARTILRASFIARWWSGRDRGLGGA